MSAAPMHARYRPGGPQARFAPIKPNGRGIRLAPDHNAVRHGRTIFPTTVNAVGHPKVKRLLKSGHNSRKIGKVVEKGRLRGFPIYTLTLEERRTCPRSCPVWTDCYGNNMPYAQRLVAGDALEHGLWEQLADLQARHPGGFLVRLHILGDFYSTDYVALWAEALDAYPALHVFGFTARTIDDPIGAAVAEIAGRDWRRFAVRVSGSAGTARASRTIERGATDPDAITCPAQTGRADRCADCTLCWQSERSIAFLKH